MRIRVVCPALLALAMLSCNRPIDIEVVRNEVRNADVAWMDAMRSKSADRFMEFLTADATLMPPNEPQVAGPVNIRDWVTHLFAMPGFDVEWEATTVEVAAAGDLAYTSGRYDLKLEMPGGAPMSDTGKYTTVWKKQSDGTWKVVVDIFNSSVMR